MYVPLKFHRTNLNIIILILLLFLFHQIHAAYLLASSSALSLSAYYCLFFSSSAVRHASYACLNALSLILFVIPILLILDSFRFEFIISNR